LGVLCCHLNVQILIYFASTLECRTDSYETFSGVFKGLFCLATQKWETLRTANRRDSL
jgi:hypothetical protein